MATITTTSHGNYLNTARRQYITLTAFQNDIFQYTTTLNPKTFVTSGSLVSLGSLGIATSTNSPANRILRENGKKLYPSGLVTANSVTDTVGPYPGVTTYMVGVYDAVSGLSGYIDPNSQVFAVYNGDKPNYVPRGIDPNTGNIDQGAGVYTLGNGSFGGYLNVGSYVSTGTYVQAATYLQAGSYAQASTTMLAGTLIGYGGPAYSGPFSATQAIDKTTAVTVNGPVVNITMANTALNRDTTVSFTLSNTSITANDTLVVQHQATGTFGAYNLNGRVTGAGVGEIAVRNILPATDLTEQIVLRVYVLSS